MGWLITGLLLALFGGLAVFTHRARRRPVTDDTLIAELLGPPAGRVPPATPARAVVAPPPAPPARAVVAPPPAPAAQPAGEGNWLETQLASLTAWSERMQEQIASWATDPDLPEVNREPEAAALPADASRLTDHGPAEPPQSRPAPRRCIATTAKGGQCKLPAKPGGTTCAIHAKRPHP